jgi:selenocysteine lyase/cysteine desulfurase
MELLGLLKEGGVTRVGVSLYTTEQEIERLVQEVGRIARLSE